MSRLLFLSHSGIDTEAASALKQRLLSAPAARDHDLSVWFDKDDLRAGEPWLTQLEDAIAKSHAFAVYVGSKGVVNWVEAEVRLALNRAVTDPDYRFIPVLAKDAPGPEALPGFAQQFQGVVDVENTAEQFEKLTRAILDDADAEQIQLESEPFFGLRAIDENRSHLFFGREKETKKLVKLLSRTPLVLVTGDSGSGKSSLVRAGLVPRFHGGALDLLNDKRPEDTIWHVVTTRPRNHPFRQLGDAVDHAATGLGLSLADRGALADWAASGDLDKVRRALRCGLPPEQTRVLLVVDQFEELLTITPPEFREPFVDLLLDLADPTDGRHRVVLTMRHDYVNLCNAHNRLRERLDADDRRARFRLGRMTNDGLRQIVTEPLRLAGIDETHRKALARSVLRDVGDRPGDLALVQMALTESWSARGGHKGDLLLAYDDIGRVEGALAQAAERVRTQVLDDNERYHLDSILLRLVRLGDTGGATRRGAARNEFDEARWSLIQTMATPERKRLVLLGGSTEQPTVEIAHEALVTAWPHFQTLLQAAPEEKRILDAFIPRARAWAAETDRQSRDKRLATGADLELFSTLLNKHSAWLSQEERRFVQASLEAEAERQRRKQEMKEALRAERDKANAAAKVAQEKEMEARANESRALAALSEIARYQHHNIDAVKLALAGWPRNADSNHPKIRAAIYALGKALLQQREILATLEHDAPVWGAVFNRNESRILTWSRDKTARLWDTATGQEVISSLKHNGPVWGAVLNKDESRILTCSYDNTARLWDAVTGEALLPPLQHAGSVRGAVFNSSATLILTWSEDKTVRIWDATTGMQVIPSFKHESRVVSARFSRKETLVITRSVFAARLWNANTGKTELVRSHKKGGLNGATLNKNEDRILTWSEDNSARLWDAHADQAVLPHLRHGDKVRGAMFSGDETCILTWSADNSARLWDAANGREILRLNHEAPVSGADFNGDGTRILTWSEDHTVRLWDTANGKEVLPPLRHEGAVGGAVFNGDETRILTWSEDHTVRLWDTASGAAVLIDLRHRNGVVGAVFNSDETRVLSWSMDGTTRLWDVANGEPCLPPLKHEAAISGADCNGDGTRILTWSMDHTVRLWDTANGKEVLLPLRHEDDVRGAWFNGDETRILTWSDDHTVRLWDTASGHALLPPLRHEGPVSGAWFNGDETRILTWSDDHTVRLWDTANGKQVLPPLKHEAAILGADCNGDGTRILTWSMDHTVRLWDTANGKEVLLPLRHEDDVRGAWFNGDETRILTWSDDHTVRLWDTASGHALLPPLRHEGPVSGAWFNGDETRILTCSEDHTVRLWDTVNGKEVLPPLRHEDEAEGAVFSEDETRILTWSNDNTARLWDAATGMAILPPLRHKSSISGATFTSNDTRILTWSWDSTARLWDISRLPRGHLIDVACGMLPDHDTSGLKERYGVAITEPICGPDPPTPVWTELVD